MVDRWIRCCFCLLSTFLSTYSWAAEPPLPEVAPDWQLPYTVNDELIAYADTRGTHVRTTNGNNYLLLNDGRGFPPVVTEHYIYATSVNGSLLAWDRSQRETLWHRHFDSWVFPPLVIGEELYLAGQASELLKLNAKTGVTLASVALPNEAIYSPVNWNDGQVGVGTYARQWQVIERDPFRQIEQFEVPEPPISATPDGRFLSQSGNLHRRLHDDTFVQLVDGKNSVAWFDNRGHQLYWASGFRLWNSSLNDQKCLEASAPFTHVIRGENDYLLQVTNNHTILHTPMPSWHRDNTVNEEQERENNDDKANVNRHQRSAHRQHGVNNTCGALRDQ